MVHAGFFYVIGFNTIQRSVGFNIVSSKGDKQFRFAKRQIFHSFLYRKAKKEDVMA